MEFFAVDISLTAGQFRNRLKMVLSSVEDNTRQRVHGSPGCRSCETNSNSLPDTIVKAESVNSLNGRLDRFWNDQEVKYNWKADIKGTESRRNIV